MRHFQIGFHYFLVKNKCSDRSMGVKLPALSENMRRPKRPTNGHTDGLIGKFHFKQMLR